MQYMRRCLQLAACGRGRVSPNPMVGAVIVCDGKIVGEGYHRQFGGPHAEVNAVASMRDPECLSRSTLYVSLEPCSHYGKTPPCSRLIIEKKIPRVVVGCLDPFPSVSGRGVAMLREAGVEVVTGVLEAECRALNAAFMTAHERQRPYVVLKWAQSRDGFIDRRRRPEEAPCRFSDAQTSLFVHRLRAGCDAILVGARTAWLDNPTLTLRLWPGRRSPLRVVLGCCPRMCIIRCSIFHSPSFLNCWRRFIARGLPPCWWRAVPPPCNRLSMPVFGTRLMSRRHPLIWETECGRPGLSRQPFRASRNMALAGSSTMCGPKICHKDTNRPALFINYYNNLGAKKKKPKIFLILQPCIK